MGNGFTSWHKAVLHFATAANASEFLTARPLHLSLRAVVSSDPRAPGPLLVGQQPLVVTHCIPLPTPQQYVPAAARQPMLSGTCSVPGKGAGTAGKQRRCSTCGNRKREWVHVFPQAGPYASVLRIEAKRTVANHHRLAVLRMLTNLHLPKPRGNSDWASTRTEAGRQDIQHPEQGKRARRRLPGAAARVCGTLGYR